MNYEEWLGSVPIEITGDPLWKVEAYRLALFVGELGWHDVTKLLLTMIPDQRPATFHEDSAPLSRQPRTNRPAAP